MEPDFKEYNEFLKEIEIYRKSTIDDIEDKYVNNCSQDILIDMKTLKITSFKGKEFKMPSYSTLTSYFCEPAQKLIKQLSSRLKEDKDTSEKEDKDTSEKEDKDTSQKEPLEWSKDSGIGTDTSGTAESSPESFTSSDEEFGLPVRGRDSNVSGKDLDISRKISKSEFSLRRHDSKVSEDLDSSPKFSICDLSIGKGGSKVFEKDLDSSQKKSKWGNRKPTLIAVRRNPAFKRDTSFLQNIPVDDVSISSRLSESSNSINCSSKHSSIYCVKIGQTEQEQKTKRQKKTQEIED